MRRSFGESSGRRARMSAGTSTRSVTTSSIGAGVPGPRRRRPDAARAGTPRVGDALSAMAGVSRCYAPRWSNMSISVEDWDELSEARRRRDERAAPLSTPDGGLDDEAEAAEQAAAPRALALVADAPPEETDDDGVYLDEEAFGQVVQNLRLPAYVAGANMLAWLAGRLTGIVELVGLAFFVSIVLLIAAYVLREWQRAPPALICLAGALPLPITIFSYFT